MDDDLANGTLKYTEVQLSTGTLEAPVCALTAASSCKALNIYSSWRAVPLNNHRCPKLFPIRRDRPLHRTLTYSHRATVSYEYMTETD